MTVIVNEENILRCTGKGRRQYTPLSYYSKKPIYFNDKHDISKLIVEEIHERYKKIGLKQTLNELRQIFWVVSGRNFVRRVFIKCLFADGVKGKYIASQLLHHSHL